MIARGYRQKRLTALVEEVLWRLEYSLPVKGGWFVPVIFLINPVHSEAGRIRPLAPFEIVWDGRLFGPAPGTVATGR